MTEDERTKEILVSNIGLFFGLFNLSISTHKMLQYNLDIIIKFNNVSAFQKRPQIIFLVNKDCLYQRVYLYNGVQTPIDTTL